MTSMRLTGLLTLALLLPASAATADPMVTLPGLEASTGVRVRTGYAGLEGVGGFEWDATGIFVTAMRASYAARPDLEVSLAVSAALLVGHGNDLPTADGGFGLPAVGLAWSRPVNERLRVGVGVIAAAGARQPDGDEDVHPGDVAAGAFFVDPEIVWTQAHMGLLRGGLAWSHDATTLRADLGVQAYVGGTLPELTSILRASGGVARRLGGPWSASVELLLESDAHHEGLGDETDLVPALTAGVRRGGRWDVGLAVSRAWTQPRSGVGEAGLSFLVDLSRKY